MDKLTALTVFRRVAELKSFNQAARALRLSNAAVSKNVRELEGELGARLIHRTTRKLHLTAAGEAYYQQVTEILDQLRQADTTISELGAAPRGLLRVSAPMSLGLTLLAATVAEFLNQYPELRIELEMNDRYVDLVHEGFDVALRGGGAMTDSSLVRRKLIDLRRAVCAAPSYLSYHGVPKSPASLTAHRCLIYTLSSSPTRWTFRKGKAVRTIDVDGPLRVNSSLGLVRAAEAGTGLALVPLFTVREELHRGTLKPILSGWKTEPQALYAVYPQHREASQKLRLFLDFIATRLATHTV